MTAGTLDDRRAAYIERLKQLDALETKKAEQDLHFFLKLMWPVMESRPFLDNWHIGAMCEHLQAVEQGQIKHLVINVPPGTSKSITVSVAFPAWCWTRDKGKRFLCLSHSDKQASDNSSKMHDLVTSDRFQRRWPIEFKRDRERVTRYETSAGGWRVSLGFNSSFIGLHPHVKILDDPHNTKNKILTDAEIKDAEDVYTGLSQRGVAMDSSTVLLMQRLHERDLTGFVLDKGIKGLVHLCFPMRYEPPKMVDLGGGQKGLKPRMPVTPLGFQDPRTEPGELLWPEMYPLEKIEEEVRTNLGPWGESGQYQQRPTPEGGLLFKQEDFQYMEAMPTNVLRWVRFWDVAGTEGGSGPRTAGVLMGVTADKRYVIADVVKGRWAAPGVDTTIHATAQRDGRRVYVREELEGGSAGKAVVSARAVRLAGFNYDGWSISGKGDKVVRAEPLAVQVAAHNVYLVVDDEAKREAMREFVEEAKVFPLGALKDQIDAAGGAFWVLTDENVGETRLLYAQPPSPEAVARVEDEIARLERELGLREDGDEGDREGPA